MSCAVMRWLLPLLLLLSGATFCNALHSLYPVDVGLDNEDPWMPTERDEFDDCHLRYLRYGRVDYEPQEPPAVAYEASRDYSHVAAIGWTQPGGAIDWACTGTLIRENFVLTSAHCTMDEESNVAPDVVRLGEANPAHIQQRNVSYIARHPEFGPGSEGHDIAMLQLESRITVNETVAPSCLWFAADTIFPRLQSVVRTGEGIPPIATVESAPTTGRSCGSSTGETLCVAPVGAEPTECFEAPAGSPLQVRLGHNYKTSPFLVGIRAGRRSGAPCQPTGSYTRIGPHRDWIVQVLTVRKATVATGDFHPAGCALRYAHVRPRVDRLLQERFDDIEQLATQVEREHELDLRYIVRFVWPAEAEGRAGVRNDCAGTFVDQRTVLTLAECVAATPDGQQPTAVVHTGRYANTSLPIQSITVHPGYVPGSASNNLAVIKLPKPDEVVPACVWPLDDALQLHRVDLAGVGGSPLIPNLGDRMSDAQFVFPSHHLRAVDYLPWANCTAELASFNATLRGASEEQHVCFRNARWLVPDACRLLPGAPLQRYVGRAGAAQKYVYALSLAGRSCGHGIPAVALLLRPHVPWLRSVLLGGRGNPPRPGASDSVFVINPDLRRSDECSNGDGTVGICVPYTLCLSTPDRLRAGGRVTLCSDGAVVCCPWGDIARTGAVNPVRHDLEACEARSQEFRERRLLGREANSSEYDNFPHLAELGWPQSNGRIQFNCIGYLITTNTIVTSARCADGQPWKPTVARIGSLNADSPSSYLLQPIRRVTVHEEYDDSTGVHNVALVQLTAHIQPTVHYFPGCVFRNESHVPARQYGVHYEGDSLLLERIFPLYGADCRDRLPPEQTLAVGHVCYLKRRPESVFLYSSWCFGAGDLMVWSRLTDERRDDADYLVALYNHGSCRALEDVQTATRIAAYYDWIVSNIK